MDGTVPRVAGLQCRQEEAGKEKDRAGRSKRSLFSRASHAVAKSDSRGTDAQERTALRPETAKNAGFIASALLAAQRR